MNGITLFSGMGGSALGMQAAGIKELYFNDWEAHAIDCLKENFKGLPDHCYDGRGIEVVKGPEVLKWIGLKKGELDFLQMSPPCQDFSNLSNKVDKAFTKRNKLYAEGLRIAKELQPKVIIIENVQGFVGNTRIFLGAINEIDNLGYNCDGWVLDSAYYGCKQSRPRAWIIAYRKDLGKTPTKPRQTSKPTPLNKVLPYVKWIYTPQYQGVLLPASKPLPTVTKTPNLYFVYDGTKMPSLNEDNNTAYQFDEKLIEQMAKRPSDHFIKQPTIEELKILSDIPEKYNIIGDSYIKKWNRLGNAVLPKMAQTLVEHIKSELNLA